MVSSHALRGRSALAILLGVLCSAAIGGTKETSNDDFKTKLEPTTIGCQLPYPGTTLGGNAESMVTCLFNNNRGKQSSTHNDRGITSFARNTTPSNDKNDPAEELRPTKKSGNEENQTHGIRSKEKETEDDIEAEEPRRHWKNTVASLEQRHTDKGVIYLILVCILAWFGSVMTCNLIKENTRKTLMNIQTLLKITLDMITLIGLPVIERKKNEEQEQTTRQNRIKIRITPKMHMSEFHHNHPMYTANGNYIHEPDRVKEGTKRGREQTAQQKQKLIINLPKPEQKIIRIIKIDRPNPFDECPKHHPLIPYVTTIDGGRDCDGCGKIMPKGSTLHGCRMCDHDLCGVCHGYEIQHYRNQMLINPSLYPQSPGRQTEIRFFDTKTKVKLTRPKKNTTITLFSLAHKKPAKMSNIHHNKNHQNTHTKIQARKCKHRTVTRTTKSPPPAHQKSKREKPKAHKKHKQKLSQKKQYTQAQPPCNKNDNGGGEYAAPAASATRSKTVPKTYATVLIISLMCTAIIAHEHNTGNTLSQPVYEQFASELTFPTITPIIKIHYSTGNLNMLVEGTPDKQPTAGWMTDYAIK